MSSRWRKVQCHVMGSINMLTRKVIVGCVSCVLLGLNRNLWVEFSGGFKFIDSLSCATKIYFFQYQCGFGTRDHLYGCQPCGEGTFSTSTGYNFCRTGSVSHIFYWILFLIFWFFINIMCLCCSPVRGGMQNSLSNVRRRTTRSVESAFMVFTDLGNQMETPTSNVTSVPAHWTHLVCRGYMSGVL